jgi:hypothetical protein
MMAADCYFFNWTISAEVAESGLARKNHVNPGATGSLRASTCGIVNQHYPSIVNQHPGKGFDP